MKTDYKFLVIVMSDRLHLVLDDIVHSDQEGFIRNRFLQHNVRKVVNVTDKAARMKNAMILFFADAKKAFDRIEWSLLLF